MDDRRAAAADAVAIDTRDYARSDVVYSYGLEEVLEVLKKSAVERGAKASQEFYFFPPLLDKFCGDCHLAEICGDDKFTQKLC